VWGVSFRTRESADVLEESVAPALVVVKGRLFG
jgi:hypothetical protein